MRHYFSAACGLLLACTAAFPLQAQQGFSADSSLPLLERRGEGFTPAAPVPPVAAETGPVLPPLSAAPNPVVVELFTSQGCVSCPPADAYFAGLVAEPGVIALSLHVDYWDYIGWEDSFGSPAFTERQKSYARAIGSRTIYTPQFIIAGSARIQGLDPAGISAALAEARTRPPEVRLAVERHGDRLVILAGSDQRPAAPLLVDLVRFEPEATVGIERGENAGTVVSYRNIVLSWERLGEWSGEEHLEVAVPMTGPAPGVLIIQEPGPGEILAAMVVE
ncbi:DUF1223 domain-containing protein [Pseudogemmobacter faecipullorum]|uniref:DUF1223 domain-containing protein n=1 Tax=Pseudogemmobacter faecipullorum TaxID=2755041 RepID=UPI001D015C4D|nr:DUF1223 domain-containing protein [Pseudogemmobacter faecipullorum]